MPIDLMNILGFNLEPVSETPPPQQEQAGQQETGVIGVIQQEMQLMQHETQIGKEETQVTKEEIQVTQMEVQAPQQGAKVKKHQAVGAGGMFGTYEVTIDKIEVLKGRYPFCSFENWKVLVPDKEGAIPHAVLGRDSIFRKFDVTYRETKEQIVFRKPKK
jgi:hypothetical protein